MFGRLIGKKEPGFVDGSHFTEHVGRIKDLKRAGRNKDAIKLLLKCVDATEAESRVDGAGVAPWYYDQLAILYRKEKQSDDEFAILERYERQKKAPGARPAKLATRLAKLRMK